MRFLLVVAIWVGIVGGLWGYISSRDSRREQVLAASPVNLSVEGQFALEITPTFSSEEDPFALKTADSSGSAFEVKLNGRAIETSSLELLRGQTIRLKHLDGILAGHNEIYVYASPPVSENSLEHGIRVKFFNDNVLIVDQTIWADQGALVSGTVSFSQPQNEEGSHDH